MPKKANNKQAQQTQNGEVLLKVGGLKYKTPGRRQRIVIGSLVIGLNALLLLAVALYFYSPTFHDFIYTVGRS